MKSPWLTLGAIVAPLGLRGEVKVLSQSDFPERFLRPGPRWLQSPRGDAPQATTLLKGRPASGKNLYIVQLAEVTNRSQAEALVNHSLVIPRAERQERRYGGSPLAPEEYHTADLIDLPVYLEATGALLGRVEDVYEAGHDLLVVSTGEKRHLIPFVRALVPVVDLEAGRIEIDPPLGLLEL
ncbi:MAG: ribosome maturation factor RimM [Cyanobacteriota bacterium]|jgi:16S rRNA processing protein RimM